MSAAIRQTIRFSVIFGMLFLLCTLVVWHAELLDALRDPIIAMKKIWWLQTKGPTTGALEVLKAFLGFSFVAPNYTYIMLPESTNMRDFREWSFTGVGAVTVILWFVFFAIGIVCAFLNRNFRTIAIGMAVALVFNILFHLDFQFRGSVFLYAAHTHFLVFALSAGGALLVANHEKARAVYIGALALLTALVAINNISIARDFATEFDTPDTSCQAPCR